MKNEWRVDRAAAPSSVLLCGMNSIRHLGESEADAQAAFDALEPGLDVWDQPNPRFGVVLSRWSEVETCFVPAQFKAPAGHFLST